MSATSGFLYGFTHAFVAGVNKCSRCAYDVEGWCHDSVVDNEIPLKTCRSCDQPHGFDDTSAIDELEGVVREALVTHGIKQCSCGNADLGEIRLEGENLVCMKCNTTVYTPEDSNVGLQCRCGNSEPELINMYEEDGRITGLECLACQQVKQFMSDGGSLSSDGRSETELIKDYSRLRVGDHIAWCRPTAGYYHHALVLESSSANNPNHVVVIEYGNDTIERPTVRIRDVVLSDEPGNLFRYRYPSTYGFQEAINRALDRLGETSYNPLTNNCEHFVRWCRTGVKLCVQVSTVARKMQELGQNFMADFVSKVGDDVINFAGKAVGRDIGADAAAEGMEFMFCGGSCQIFEVIGAVAITALEAWNFYKDYKTHKQDLEQGKIDQHEFTNRNIRSSTMGIARWTGTLAGGFLGELVCPVIGSVLGTLIGGFIGQLCGHYLGHRITYMRDKHRS